MAAAVGGFAAWLAMRVHGIAARVGFALVEGFVFALSPRSIATVLAAELAAFGIVAGPRAPLRVAAGTLAALGTLQTWRWLIRSFRHAHSIEEGLQSIWDWEPPASESSGAWHILRQLAITVNELRKQNPAIAALLDQPELTGNELAMRLFWYYKSADEPLLSAAQLAALAAGEPSAAGGKGGKGGKGAPAQQAQQGEPAPEERVAPVPPELKAQLAHYRWASCLSYDFPTDEALSEQLASRGYVLLAASYAADLASSCPAYFLALSEERHEVLLCCRGTFSPEDAFVDLLATGSAFDADGEDGAAAAACRDADAEPGAASGQRRLTGYCHSGMGRAALFLGRKFGGLLRQMCEGAGYQVALAGHSLGAGVASLLAVYLRNRGLPAGRLQCWAYETPACMDLALARACSDVVVSLVNADDVVPRACMRSLAGLLEELAVFDWRAAAAAAVEQDGEGSDVAAHLSRLLRWAIGAKDGSTAGSGSAAAAGEVAEGLLHAAAHEVQAAAEGGGGAEGPRVLERLGSGGFQRQYNAHVPGRVVLIYPLPAEAASGKGGEGAPTKGGEGLPPCGLALVDCASRAVMRLRVSPSMILDHFIDKAPVLQALGG